MEIETESAFILCLDNRALPVYLFLGHFAEATRLEFQFLVQNK